MPAAVVHFIVSMLLVRFFAKKLLKINDKSHLRQISFLGGIAGLLPDTDMLIVHAVKILGFSPGYAIHRTITHSLILPLVLLLMALLFYRKKWVSIVLLIMALGSTVHITLDFITSNNLMLFYPFSESMSGVGLVPINDYGGKVLLSLDAAVFLLWIGWLFYKNKLTDFV